VGLGLQTFLIQRRISSSALRIGYVDIFPCLNTCPYWRGFSIKGGPPPSIIRYPYLAKRYLDSDDDLPSHEARNVIKEESVKFFYHDDMEQMIFCLFMCAKHVDILREMGRGRGYTGFFPYGSRKG
jgi:hypothetical protein